MKGKDQRDDQAREVIPMLDRDGLVTDEMFEAVYGGAPADVYVYASDGTPQLPVEAFTEPPPRELADWYGLFKASEYLAEPKVVEIRLGRNPVVDLGVHGSGFEWSINPSIPVAVETETGWVWKSYNRVATLNVVGGGSDHLILVPALKGVPSLKTVLGVWDGSVVGHRHAVGSWARFWGAGEITWLLDRMV